MSTTRWKQVREIFESACDLDPADRDAFLSRACGRDVELRAEVESIITSSDDAPPIMDLSAESVFPELFDDAESLVGRRIGQYELLRFIASGGMGTVYLAERTDDRDMQRVAIKLIRQRMATAEATRRFRQERRMLAGLDHANIAKLLDGGVTDDGMPYLVMEHVEGQPIDLFCDDRRLDTRSRLRLFEQVGRAVIYAHQNLVIHRDLKPSNILVTHDGIPKLLDFGIAKAIDMNGAREGATTVTSRRIMTPEYASPEQIRGEAMTTATDVYSLGVVLYELLTGHRPYPLRTRLPHEIERTICEDDPERPSTAIRRVEEVGGSDGATRATLTPESVSASREGEPEKLRRRLMGDLDAIVLAALCKQPADRYASVEQFLDDIRRHLAGLPVRARRPTWRYRVAKFVWRNRSAVLAAMVVALSLTAAVAGIAWQARAAILARQGAQEEVKRTRQVNEFLNDMLASVDAQSANGPNDTVTRMLDDATARLAEGVLRGQPEVEAELRLTLGTTYLELGLLEHADQHLNIAMDLRTALQAPQADVAECLDSLGLLAKTRGEYEEAERLYHAALELHAESMGEHSVEYAATLNNLGVLVKTMGRLDEAEALLTEALDRRRALQRNDPGASDLEVDVATTMTNLAAVLKNAGDHASAEGLYREAVEIFRSELGRDHYRVAVTLNNLALLLRDTGRAAEAEPLFRQALAIRRTVFGDEHLAVATGLKNLALVLVSEERYDEAEPLYREALAMGRRLSGDPRRMANTLTGLADLLTSVGALEEAEALAREALEIRRERNPDDARIITCLVVLGRVQLERGDLLGADQLLREAMMRGERQLQPGHMALAKVQSELGCCLARRGAADEAEPLLLAAEEIITESGDRRWRRRVLGSLVELYVATGRADEVAQYEERLERELQR